MSSARHKKHLWLCMLLYIAVLLVVCLIAEACSGRSSHTPLPKAYPRIAMSYDTTYTDAYHPVNMLLNKNAQIDSSTVENGIGFHVRYDKYAATLFCSVNMVGENEIGRLLATRLERVMLDAGKNKVETYRYESPCNNCHAATFYDLQGSSVTPIHFIATDSTKYVVSGTVVLDNVADYDSISPILDYMGYDVARLIKDLNFNGK